MTRPTYDFYADMYETHTEIGYLLWIIIALITLDAGLGVALWKWPHPDVYLVPGIDSYAQVSMQWGAHPPIMPAPSEVPAEAAEPIMLQMPETGVGLDPSATNGTGREQAIPAGSSSASAVQ